GCQALRFVSRRTLSKYSMWRNPTNRCHTLSDGQSGECQLAVAPSANKTRADTRVLTLSASGAKRRHCSCHRPLTSRMGSTLARYRSSTGNASTKNKNSNVTRNALVMTRLTALVTSRTLEEYPVGFDLREKLRQITSRLAVQRARPAKPQTGAHSMRR